MNTGSIFQKRWRHLPRKSEHPNLTKVSDNYFLDVTTLNSRVSVSWLVRCTINERDQIVTDIRYREAISGIS